MVQIQVLISPCDLQYMCSVIFNLNLLNTMAIIVKSIYPFSTLSSDDLIDSLLGTREPITLCPQFRITYLSIVHLLPTQFISIMKPPNQTGKC